MSFEVSEENWLVRSSVGGEKNQVQSMGQLQGSWLRQELSRLQTQVSNQLPMQQLCRLRVACGSTVPRSGERRWYSGAIHRDITCKAHETILLLYSTLERPTVRVLNPFVLDSTTHQKMWRNCRRSVECKNDQTCLSCTESKHPCTPFSNCRLTSVSFTPATGI